MTAITSEKDIREVLFAGLESVSNKVDFLRRSGSIEEAAFTKIIADHYAGRIKWTRTKEGLRGRPDFTAEAIVRNAQDAEIAIPVILHVGDAEDDWVYLQLGDKHGPCRNSGGKRIRELYDSL